MNSKSLCCPEARPPAGESDMRILSAPILAVVWLLAFVSPALAGDAPQWMHAAANAPLPAHDEKTDAVLLYSEQTLSVLSVDKIKTHVRLAYKILRPSGREYGIAGVAFHGHSKVSGLRGWCIPAQGKDYEVKDKEALEVALP